MNKEELIIGRKYQIKSKEWFNENYNKQTEVLNGTIRFDEFELCGKSFVYNGPCYNNALAEINVPTQFSKWNSIHIPIFALEPDPNDTRVLSEEIIQLTEKIKEYKFIYSSRNATGGGRGQMREMKNEFVVPCFNHEGIECIQLPGGDHNIPIKWKIEQARELVANKKIEHNWKFSEWTHVRDNVELGNEQESMPKDFGWQDR